jgi:hypothetical protein
MFRNFIAWLLIVVGLIGVVGGLGMAVVSSIALGTAADNARQENRMNPFAVVPARGPNSSDKLGLFGMAAVYVVVGGAMVYGGVRLRGSPSKSTAPGKRRE